MSKRGRDGYIQKDAMHVSELRNIYPYNFIGKVLGVQYGKDEEGYRVYPPGAYEAIQDLTEREKRVIELRYIHNMTLEESGKRLGVTKERIRQVEMRAMRKMRHPGKKVKYLLPTRMMLESLEDDKRRLIEENERIKNGMVSTDEREKRRKIRIDDIGLSVRSFNCLKRAGINTLEDFDGMTYQDLAKVRNLGKRSIKEIVTKLRVMGVEIPYAE